MSTSEYRFETKGATLGFLQDKLKSAAVPPLKVFTVREWRHHPDAILLDLRKSGFFTGKLAVRSSALTEDTLTESNAGKFLSILNVAGEASLKESVEKVILSYGVARDDDQVLIQPMLEQVRFSGVAFSCDPTLLSPYRVFSFQEGEDTAGVTSGNGSALQTVYCVRGEEARLPQSLQPIASLLAELEAITLNSALDIEFAVTAEGLFLLQCRPLVLSDASLPVDGFKKRLSIAEKKISELSKPHPYLLGETTLFGVMPDWNPAEIIGLKPRPLALSLYRELITSGIWAFQRDNYGYRNVRSFPLLVDFWGLPYIDVRVSFNSFIPKTIEKPLGEKLVEYYLNALRQAPTLHDKVEFEIALTCYTLDLDSRLERLAQDGFSQQECQAIRVALRNLTEEIIHPDRGLWRKDIEKIRELEKRIPGILQSNLDPISRIYWLIEDCKRYGTLPFAGLARAGFIAVQMLQSLVRANILTASDYERFFLSLDTVSSRLCQDFHSLERTTFLEKYGHLRPGTYDLLSPRYDQEPDRYFDWSTKNRAVEHKQTPFSLELEKLKKIEVALARNGLTYSALDFLDFIRAAIEGREYSKFVFTKSLSATMEIAAAFGASVGFSREDVSFADIQAIMRLYSGTECEKTALAASIDAGRSRFQVTQSLRLPPLIANPESIYCFDLPSTQPNFITRKRVSGSVVRLSKDTGDFRGGIVFIPSADPGYDWIFSKNIQGLITMFGGANSHMAIRAGELGIPAVIGAGESLYNNWSRSDFLELDCENHKVQPIR